LQSPAEASAPIAAEAAADADVAAPVDVPAAAVVLVVAAVEVVVEVVELFEPPPHPAPARTVASSDTRTTEWWTLERIARSS
jgi:hypothetical protein